MKHHTTKPQRDLIMIESLVRKHGTCTRGKIHELTLLQRSDISRSVRTLLDQGRLIEAGRAENLIGRKQILLRINKERGFVVGVSFDAETVVAATLDLDNELKSLVTESTDLDGGEAGLVAQLLSSSRKAIKHAGVASDKLMGIGVAGCGLVDTREGTMIMSATLDFLRDVQLKRIFEKEFRAPTLVENLSHAKTVAERETSPAEATDNMIYIDYGMGIGAGIIVDGKLLYSRVPVGSEFGHTHMTENGPPCKCGSFGCLEAIVGYAAIRARIQNAIKEGGYSEALAVAGGDPSQISWLTVLKASKNKDKACMTIVEQLGLYLGVGLANLVNIFNPSLIVLDHRLSAAGDDLLNHITEVIRRKALTRFTKDLIVHFGRLGVEAGVLGIGSLVLDRLFEIPALKSPPFLMKPWGAPASRRVPPEARLLQIESNEDACQGS